MKLIVSPDNSPGMFRWTLSDLTDEEERMRDRVSLSDWGVSDSQAEAERMGRNQAQAIRSAKRHFDTQAVEFEI